MAECDRIEWTPEVVSGAAAILVALSTVPDASRLDALALAAKAYVEKPESVPAFIASDPVRDV